MGANEDNARPLDDSEEELFEQIASQFVARPGPGAKFAGSSAMLWCKRSSSAPWTFLVAAICLLAAAPLAAVHPAAGAASVIVVYLLCAQCYKAWARYLRDMLGYIRSL